MKRNIVKLGYFFIFIFMVLIVYLGYINVYWGPQLEANPYNLRLAREEERIIRGRILDSQGLVLAEDVVTAGNKERHYPLGEATAQLVGFVSSRYGRTGLEATLNSYLLAMDDIGKVDKVINGWLNKTTQGYDVHLTVEGQLQQKAVSLLGDRAGAVVALEPSTGAVLVMASAPSYDPNRLHEVVDERLEPNETQAVKITYFDTINADAEKAPLLNRAVSGMYPPGSTFKVITAAGILSDKPELANEKQQCVGKLVVDGFTLTDTGVHGSVDLADALRVSCNTAFAQYGLDLGEEGLRKAAEAFGFAQKGEKAKAQSVLDKDAWQYVQFSPGTLSADDFSKTETASAAIGQGDVMTSPMQMALVAAGIANQGKVMTPYVVDRVVTPEGKIRMTSEAKSLGQGISPTVAAELREDMKGVVQSGTGTAASIAGIQVAGKTGSAQNPHGNTHAWFIGFAPANDPIIAVAVVVENGGAGGQVAAPIAREIMAEYLHQN